MAALVALTAPVVAEDMVTGEALGAQDMAAMGAADKPMGAADKPMGADKAMGAVAQAPIATYLAALRWQNHFSRRVGTVAWSVSCRLEFGANTRLYIS